MDGIEEISRSGPAVLSASPMKNTNLVDSRHVIRPVPIAGLMGFRTLIDGVQKKDAEHAASQQYTVACAFILAALDKI